MRLLPFVFILSPGLALADQIDLQSRVSAVTLFPQGAKITRTVPFEAKAGAHELRLFDMPRGTPMESLRISVSGAAMGAITTRSNFVPPAPERESEAVKAAKADITRLEEALATKQDEAAALRAAKEAADTRIAFLWKLSEGQALSGADIDRLREVSRMVGDEALAARRAAIEGEARARAVDEEAKEINEDLTRARKALAALQPGETPRDLVSVAIEADQATQGTLEISYVIENAGWSPVYDAFLDREAAYVTLKRGALVYQESGEAWSDVALTLSTNRPGGAVEPADLWPQLRRIGDPVQVMRKSMMDSAGAPEPMMEPMIVEEARASVVDGLSVSYDYPKTVNLASGADTVRLALGDMRFDATLRAEAVPSRQEVAFLTADFTNTSDEMILPSAATQLFRDGDYVGTVQGGMIAAGGTAQLGFGPIEGLRLTRLIERNEGDRGMISRSSELSEEVRIEVENLTGQSWPLRVIDQVPYSEQEDLEINWNASPRPGIVDLDDAKGILAWDSEIAPGQTTKITLNYSLKWPDGKVLR
ncbi:DUF4139 domain-containing protein [Rhodalgimonas zhirmunskyi]|uniref:DUF4139 domain-containing protein n=1 Tax=Rhodalgimonas zhirmunskyi TaxID=2964767 RepID=A0AAJ1UDK0_9RHOB|nr:DUF4139 domain-containing protein [Rhodoalgimonas zhirmunskyi]MDQ2094127.1 DUF4139 domain-containing protein [Rhodoalgimonas zhirmunskyi]